MCCIWGCTVLYMSVAVAADLTIPNTFAPGTPAVAADINSNFNATATAVNSKQNRVVGTCPPGQSISVINQDGSVTCQLGGDTSGVEFVNNTLGVALTATAATVATITVTVPAAGFLIASGYGNAECGSAGTSLTVTLQNATTAVVSPSTFDSRPTAGEFRYYAVHYVFAVTAGVNTINLRASCGTGTGLMNINTLNAIFVPNRY
jgi:hypothetical protein